MSVVRFIKHESRLAKLITMPGGKTLEECVNDANENLAGVADACLAEIDKLIEQLAQRAGEVSAHPGQEDVLYLGSREIAGLAALAKRPCLGEAAHSLCVLIDEWEPARKWRPEAITVHISTLQLLRRVPQEEGSEIPRQLVNHVHDMVKRLADEERAALAAAGKAP